VGRRAGIGSVRCVGARFGLAIGIEMRGKGGEWCVVVWWEGGEGGWGGGRWSVEGAVAAIVEDRVHGKLGWSRTTL